MGNFTPLQRTARFLSSQQALWTFLFLLFTAQLVGSAIDSLVIRLLVSVFLSLFLFSTVQNISSRPAIQAGAGLLVLAAVFLRWIGHVHPTPAITGWGFLTSLVLMVALTMVSIDRVFREVSSVTVSRVVGAVAVYVLFGMTWAYLYGLLNLLLPGAFTLPIDANLADPDRLESFTYFSFVTLTTLGYGDILPVHPAVRFFAVVQALFGQLYPATLLARLVSLEIMTRQSSQKPDQETP